MVKTVLKSTDDELREQAAAAAKVVLPVDDAARRRAAQDLADSGVELSDLHFSVDPKTRAEVEAQMRLLEARLKVLEGKQIG
jgi:hypothetical protein